MYLYSTTSNAMKFNFFNEASLKHGQIPCIKKSIVVNGNANIANKYSEFPKVTETFVKDEDYEILKTHKQFKKMMKDGFVSSSSKKRLDLSSGKTAEEIIKDMEKRTKSSALTVDDIKNSSKTIKEIQDVSELPITSI